VIILADVSGSMKEGGKIDVLNESISEMIDSFKEEESVRSEIQVAVITFGGSEAVVHVPLTPATEVTWNDMTAKGTTPMDQAFIIAKTILEDKTIILCRGYVPSLVLVTDGMPTDREGRRSNNWKEPLLQLMSSERANKAMRFAIGIGEDAVDDVLNDFTKGNPRGPFKASEVREIKKFFKWVTMSVQQSSRSCGSIVDIDPDDIVEY
jgi:uncharacterized protein YegL